MGVEQCSIGPKADIDKCDLSGVADDGATLDESDLADEAPNMLLLRGTNGERTLFLKIGAR